MALEKEISSELKFLFDRNGVDIDFTGKLKEHGIDTIAKFACLVETAADLRNMLKDDFSLDGSAGFSAKAKIAPIFVARTAAKKRTDTQA